MEETVAVVQELVKLVPQERVQQRTVDVPTPQIMEDTVEVASVPHVRNSGLSMRQCFG